MFVPPLSSSAAKKAARQSSRVTMGPQNQVGIHETTNLFRGKYEDSRSMRPQSSSGYITDSEQTEKNDLYSGR